MTVEFTTIPLAHNYGVIAGSGLTAPVVQDAYYRIQEGAEAAGRRLEDLDIWFFAKNNIADDAKASVDEIRMALAASANHAFRRTLEGKHIPSALHEPMEKLKAAYRPHEHELLGAEKVHARLVDDLGLKAYLAERFAVVGTVKDCIGQSEAAGAAGVRKIFLGPAHRRPRPSPAHVRPTDSPAVSLNPASCITAMSFSRTYCTSQ